MHIKTKGSILSVVLSVLISASVVTGMVFAATTIGTNIDTGGNLTVTGTTTLTGALTANGNVTLGDAVADVVAVGGTVAGVNPLRFAGGPAAGNVIFAMPDPGTDITVTFPNLAGTVALSTNNLGVFAPTTSAQLAGVMSDETGSGALVFATSPTLTTPALGAATATSVAIGGGTPITSFAVYSPSLTPAALTATIGTHVQTFTVTGLQLTDRIVVNGPTPTSLCPMIGYRVASPNTLQLDFTVLTAAACTPAAGVYHITAVRF